MVWYADQPGPFAEFLQRVAVMRLQIVAIELHQHIPAQSLSESAMPG